MRNMDSILPWLTASAKPLDLLVTSFQEKIIKTLKSEKPKFESHLCSVLVGQT